MPHVEPVDEVEDFCVPAWFLEFMTALETPKEALEVDDQVTVLSQDPIAVPGNNQSQNDDDDPAWAKSLNHIASYVFFVGQAFRCLRMKTC